MPILSTILCVLIILLLCFSFRYSLHENGNQQPSGDFVSNAKALELSDVMEKMIRGRKLLMTSGDEVEETTMKRGNRETERKSSKSVEEDGLVAYTADYWRAKHHPPKNN
ncbi:Protein GOLVEN 7 [Cardamine amara subsp. amara]|uniref:Protein GOLVEN 7 n=1 Tax=Cardamine amara subsp. amara TaxID=228776 RepID=A0ABD1AC58_CARAN